MLEYPSISGHLVNSNIRAYPKYDGINVRVKWSKKKGFVNFGLRHTLVDENNPNFLFKNSIDVWKNKYEEIITETFSKKNIKQCVLFGEYYGKNSFAGCLDPNDDYDIMIYDCSIDDQLLDQSEYLKLFKYVEKAPIIYEGKPSQLFINKVKNGELEGLTFEGVVCKGPLDNRNNPIMFKVKSNAWYEKLKLRCNGDQKLFEELK